MSKFYYIPIRKNDEMQTPAVAHPLLDRTRPVVLMTADNPSGDPSVKGKYTTEGDLVKDLKAHNVNFELTHGKYVGVPEKSIIAYDMPIELAHQLAKKYGQESYIHIDPSSGGAKFVYAYGSGPVDPTKKDSPKIKLEGTMHKESGTPELFEQAPEDYYTFVPSANKFIRLGFDFDKLHQSPHMRNEELASFAPEENIMEKTEFTIEEVKAEIARVLKKHMEEHENFLVDLKKKELGKGDKDVPEQFKQTYESTPKKFGKESHEGKLPHNKDEERQIRHIASSYEEKGKSPEQSKAIAYATVNAQHKAESCAKCGKAECSCKAESCKKCGTMMKADMCAKCGEMSAGKVAKKNEAVSIMEKKGDKNAKGPQETPDKTKEAAKADGSGGDVAKGKLGKTEIVQAVETLIELDVAFASLFKKEESSEESSEETSSPERGSHEETPEDEESKKDMDKAFGMGRVAASGAIPAPPKLPEAPKEDKKPSTKKSVHNIY